MYEKGEQIAPLARTSSRSPTDFARATVTGLAQIPREFSDGTEQGSALEIVAESVSQILQSIQHQRQLKW